MPNRTIIDRETFFTGLLVSLTETPLGQSDFGADSDQLGRRLALALNAARNNPEVAEVDGIDWAVADDPSRLGRLVSELISFGQSARLLSLRNVDLEQARLRVGPGRDALRDAAGHPEWFRRLGDAFAGNIE